MYRSREMAVVFNSYSTLPISEKCLRYAKDGADGQFLHYLYPLSIIFRPFFICFIYGTLKMALISIFLLYLCPFLAVLLSLSYPRTGQY